MVRTALVTGASSGIGRALAHELAKDGYDLVLVSKTEQHLAEAVDELAALYPGRSYLPIVKDLTDAHAPEALYELLRSKNIVVELLVNDAGIGQQGRFVDIPLERERQLIRLNVEALTALTRLFLPEMVTSNRGGVLNVGSIAGFQPGPLLAVYHATKAFVVSFSEAIAEELKDSGVTVTCLCPGPTDTNFFATADMTHVRVAAHPSSHMDAATVARLGYQAFKDKERVYIPGVANKVMTFIRRVIPQQLQAKLNKSLYETVEE